MTPLLEIARWRQGTHPEQVEPRVRWLKERISDAERAIDAQQQLITQDGDLVAYRFSLSSLEAALRQHEHELAECMAQRELEVMDFALDGDRYALHRAGAKKLGEFMLAMQGLYLRIGHAMSTPNPKGNVPPRISRQCQLEVAGFFPSSFGIRFVAATQTELDGYSLTNTAMEATFMLVNTNDPMEEAAHVGRFALAKYRKLVNTLIDAEATPKVSWRNPAGEEFQWRADGQRLQTLANRLADIKGLEPKIREATGSLIGASLRRKRFEFDANGEIITGSAPREIAEKITAHFGKRCTIVYRESAFIDEATDQERLERTLLDIR